MNYEKLYWQCDYLGYELGFDEIPVIGLYELADFPEITLLIDVVNDRIVDVWLDKED